MAFSGGVDSSLVLGIACEAAQKTGKTGICPDYGYGSASKGRCGDRRTGSGRERRQSIRSWRWMSWQYRKFG